MFVGIRHNHFNKHANLTYQPLNKLAKLC